MTRIIPSALRQDQHDASDPEGSAWVSANAGAGKTYVLVQRVVRLLLQGVPPSKILCLTFTKAAAANMANRVFETLRSWTALEDAALDERIAEAGGRPGSATQRARARRLFAAALDTPGGLKVRTIHGFCTGLLQQFPFEANVAARFRVLEDAQQQQLLTDVRLSVLLDASNKPDTTLGRALGVAVASATDFAFNLALDEAIAQRSAFLAWRDEAGGIERLHADISAVLGIETDDSILAVNDEFTSASLLPVAEWPGLIEVLKQGSANDKTRAACLSDALAVTGDLRIEKYLTIFFTQDGVPRANVVTGTIKKLFPAVEKQFSDEKIRLVALKERRQAILARDRTIALFTIADAVLTRYRAEKERRGLLDYEDIIVHTADLLSRVESAWVHYKLDLGIDHVLIDEAQDTSPAQWDIINRLVAEFTAGMGARGATKRSVFAVGDEKQSIFSFQGAAPDTFDAMRKEFERRHADAALRFRKLEFKYSFRSVPRVLEAVDTVFSRAEAHSGLSADLAPPIHTAIRDNAPGVVELWPLSRPNGAAEPEAWDAPFDATTQSSPRVVLARRIAAAIRTWIARKDQVGDPGARRPISPGDILVLVRARGPLFEAVIRELKNKGIAVAGADRLVLTEHIAVMDLLALADAVLLPEDDLSLAAVLRSPLFGMSEDDLFDLAHGRSGSLRAALSEKCPHMAARLDQTAATHATPYAWYARILSTSLLTEGGARKAFVARLGSEANDAIDEFLNLALDFESREIPTLQGFVSWLRGTSAEIKRDMEMARDEVRVMTVHGAKGLEAPVVILTDTTSPPAGPPRFAPRLIALPRHHAAPGAPDALVWVPNKEGHTAATDAARQRYRTAAENEYRRLLYVAMTRAADRLIVCGDVGKQAMPAGCWYDLIERGLDASGELIEQPADYGEDTIRRFRDAASLDPISPAEKTPEVASLFVPAWLSADVRFEASRQTIRPSANGENSKMPPSGNADARRAALLRGTLAHRLLQSLPEIPTDQREAAARRYLEGAGAKLPDDARAQLLVEVLTLMSDARFAPLFSPDSRSEVPLVGRITTTMREALLVTGQVDRLIVTENEVWIADYKTNRPAPRTLEGVPRTYIRQLALYRLLLGRMYPAHIVRCALVWTEVPDLMEIPPVTMQQLLAAEGLA